MKPIVHQIWIGAPPPAYIMRLCNTISQGCTSAGWEYKLWDWPMLKEHFADDPLTPELDYLMKISPIGHTYGLVSDYYRLALMAELHGRGTLYLDTDFLFEASVWPEFPQIADVYYMGGKKVPSFIRNGALWLPPGKSVIPFVTAYFSTQFSIIDQVLSRIDVIKINPYTIYGDQNVLNITGPYFFYRKVYIEWCSQGVHANEIPSNILTHSILLIPSILFHIGTSTWRLY